MITALRGLGHDVVIVAPHAGARGEMGETVGWVSKVKSCLPGAFYELLELAYSLLAYYRLARAVRSFRPDILYERYNLFMLAGVLIRKRFGLPMLLEINAPLADERDRFGGLALKKLARWSEDTVWRNADFVLPVTKVLGDYVARRGVERSRVKVIPNGINVAHFTGVPDQDTVKARLGLQGTLVLGFTGFVRDWHGVDRVIRWLASEQAPQNARLLIVGDGPARAALTQLASELNLGERVIFTGVLPRARIPAHVACFDLALQPAVVDYASPLKLFEYLALGKAIVAPAQANILEILVDGENSLLFDPDTADALERALTRLCHDDVLRSVIAAGAAATIRRRGLTWRDNATRVEELARSLMTEQRSREWREGRADP
jgi:glycosyltransferase involved in cell wall biosynthesis